MYSDKCIPSDGNAENATEQSTRCIDIYIMYCLSLKEEDCSSKDVHCCEDSKDSGELENR